MIPSLRTSLSVLCIWAFMFSCTEDHDNDQNNDIDQGAELNGNWGMVSYVAYLETLPIINENDISWDFDIEGMVLNINNKIAEDYPYILPSGEYPIIFTANTVKIDDTTYDYEVKNEKLIISDMPELDGPLMTFERKEH